MPHMQLRSLLVALLLSPVVLYSQEPPPAPQTANHETTANEITLNVTVDNKAGDPVAGLSENDFKVLDNRTPRPITSFRALTREQAPTEIVLVLDAVNLPYTRLSYARQQVDQFLSANGGKLPQPTTLAIVMDKGTQILPTYTTDANQIRASLDNYTVGLRSINRSAGFYGADERFNISLAALRMLIGQEAARPGRKRMIWISAGWPLLSGPGVDLSARQRRDIFTNIVALSTQLRTGQITMDAVNPLGSDIDVGRTLYYENFLKGVRDPNGADIGALGLQVLAQQSGGLVLNGSNDTAALLRRSFAQTDAFYQISFAAAPGEHPDEYHQVQVQLAQPGLIAHTTTGYYARPTLPATQPPPRIVPTPSR